MESQVEDDQRERYSCTRRELVNIVIASGSSKTYDEKINDVKMFLIDKTGCTSEINKFLTRFKCEFWKKWDKNSHRTSTTFFNNETGKDWLEKPIFFKCTRKRNVLSVGRPANDFENSSAQTKRKRTADLRASCSGAQLLYAAQMKLKAEGEKDAARALKNLSSSSEKEKNQSSALTPMQALSLLVEANLSRHQYCIIRSYAKEIFPSYKKVQEEKRKSYPEGIVVTETKAEVPLQCLVDDTAAKIVHSQETVFETHKAKELTMTYKWGFDGSSGHSQYHQTFQSEHVDDKFVFISCLVPLQLATENNKQIFWKNDTPSSPRHCRPMNIIFEKESDALVLAQKENIENQINNLMSTKITIKGEEIQVKHRLIFSMIDGKLCNNLSDTKSALRCYLCKGTSKDFNNIEKILKMPVVESYLEFGMSVLHAWIRLFECLLHISYKLEIKEWRTSKTTEILVKANQTRIQKEFRTKLGLIVDKPKPGYGNTNTGNVARRFFKNADVSAEITGIDINIIHRFHIILQCISSGYSIKTEKFQSYCLDTAKLYVELYPWYYMPTTVHKVLIHGHDIIKSSLLPIGQLSEEALEARNKDFKIYREFKSRKTSRTDTLTDIFNRMLISSDPFLSCCRKTSRIHKVPFEIEATQMFEEEGGIDSDDEK